MIVKQPYYITAILLLWCFCRLIPEQIFAQSMVAISTPAALTKSKITSIDSLRAITHLQLQIQKLLGHKQLQKTDLGLSVVSLQTHKDIFSYNSDIALVPASTTKLLPTFSALEQLGSNYKIVTSIYSDDMDGPDKDGVLHGNLYLIGRGDPLLTVTDIENLAAQLSHLGIKKITGSIFGDNTFFDNKTNRREYSGDNDEVQPTGPISALTIQKNIVTILVSGGPKVNQPVRVQTIPYSDSFTLTVEAQTKLQKPIKTKRKRFTKPLFSIREAASKQEGKQHFVVSGVLNPNTTVSQAFFIKNPGLAAADLLRKRLETVGITVVGKSMIRKTPNTAVILTEFHRPLMDVLQIINKKSDNFCAEHLFKMLGTSQKNGEPNLTSSSMAENRSATASVQQIQSVLTDHAISPKDWSINDGSGLSRRNRITPAVLIKLLDEAQRAPFSEVFYNSLAIAGLDGTLEYRMRGTAAEYNVHAKTGTLKNVSALAGYIRTRDGERLVFSFMFNGWGVGYYKGLENKLCELLANFSYAATLDSLSYQ